MKRAQDLALVLVVLLVLVLTASLVLGLRGRAETADPPSSPSPEPPVAERVRVEVLNASGVSGMAREATLRLRDQGFDVVFYGNARGQPPDTSQVLARTGRIEPAAAVAAALGIRIVRSEPDTTLYLEATVILGRDWSGIPAPMPPGS
jgi:hypothetical protein